MIDVVDIADRADGDVVVNRGAVRQFDPYAPFARRCAEQGNFTRLLVVNHKGVRIRDHLHLRRRAGAHIIDYVSLARIQGESHYRGGLSAAKASPCASMIMLIAPTSHGSSPHPLFAFIFFTSPLRGLRYVYRFRSRRMICGRRNRGRRHR